MLEIIFSSSFITLVHELVTHGNHEIRTHLKEVLTMLDGTTTTNRRIVYLGIQMLRLFSTLSDNMGIMGLQILFRLPATEIGYCFITLRKRQKEQRRTILTTNSHFS